MLLLQETDMNKSKISDIRYKLIRSKDGSLITTLKMPDPDKKDSIMKTMTRYYDYNAGALKYEGNKIERNLTEEKDGKIKKFITEYYSLSTGEKTETRVFDLKKLSSQVGLSKDFYLKSCNIKELANGNILYIFEEVKEDSEKKKNKSVEFGDFVFAEINKNMEVVKSAKTHIEKRIFTSKEDMDAMLEEYKEQFAGAGLTFNKSNEKFLSSIIPLEDVKFIEKMEDDTTVVFYRKKNEEGTVTNLSVISYKDEVIKTLPDFPLKTPEGGKITFLPAKSGYFLLYEEFKDKDQSPELRLEKINY